jgi:glycosyltransferase involved in cell wall biosynthesis
MRLAVATICPHVRHGGRWWSYEPFVLEMNAWAGLFSSLTLVAPLEDGPPPEMWSPYSDSSRFSVVPYRKNRGRGLEQQTTSPLELPRMVSALVRAARTADALHVRCPGNIGLVGALLGPLLSRRRIAKYAGQWQDFPGEARTVRLQKALLRSRWWGAPVTVYGAWPDQPAHIVPFFTSVLNSTQMARARQAAGTRAASRRPRALFVGRLSRAKNAHVLLAALGKLRREGLDLPCTLVGEGPERAALETQAAELGVAAVFAGGVSFDSVLSFYETHDILVLASETEGWPKAIVEAMAFGLVCIGSDRGLIPQILGEGRGLVVPPRDMEALAAALRRAADPIEAAAIREGAAPFGQRYSLEDLREALRELTERWW